MTKFTALPSSSCSSLAFDVFQRAAPTELSIPCLQQGIEVTLVEAVPCSLLHRFRSLRDPWRFWNFGIIWWFSEVLWLNFFAENDVPMQFGVCSWLFIIPIQSWNQRHCFANTTQGSCRSPCAFHLGGVVMPKHDLPKQHQNSNQ